MMDKKSTELASVISRYMIIPNITMKESLMIMVIGMCKVLHIIARLIGANPKDIKDMVIDIVTTYFDKGMDSRIDSIIPKDFFKQHGS